MPERVSVSVIDDDQAIREALGALLDGNGYDVACYDSAEAFLHAIDDRPPAVIVSDYQMPGMSGLDLSRALKARAVAAPVILITAFGGEAIRGRAERAGIARVIEKPFDAPALLGEVAAFAGSG